MKHLSRFGSAREAKEFLVSKIVEEAQREGVPLSEVERKMLYFSETHWTLPDMMEVNETFEREYDDAEYEKKVSQLARHVRTRLRKENPQEVQDCDDAIRVLSKEDHYILVMLEAGGFSVPHPGVPSAWRVFGTMILYVTVVVAGFAYFTRNMSKERAGSYLMVGVVWILGIYLILSVLLGREKRDALVTKVVDKLLGSSIPRSASRGGES